MTPLTLEPSMEQFCRDCGVGVPTARERIRAGRNSEVWRFSSGDQHWILKHYYQNAHDRRDRLGAEFEFLTCLSNQGVTSVARPLGIRPEHQWALYSFLPGTRPVIVTAEHVGQAARFIGEISRLRNTTDAQSLRPATDACFSYCDHLQLAQSRIDRLLRAESSRSLERDVLTFVTSEIEPLWSRLKAKVLAGPHTEAVEKPVDSADRILSPSDFGFHNALDDQGRVYFLDFEYAGWDDPAKLICDFICQPELPVSSDQARQFVDHVLEELAGTDDLRHRVEALVPVHRVKWCGILLNELEPEGRQRRIHAGRESEQLLEEQFSKAKAYFAEHLGSVN